MSILTIGVLVALNREGRTRSYWLGFAVVGFLYFLHIPCKLAAHQNPASIQVFGSMEDRNRLITTRLSRHVYSTYVFPRILATSQVAPYGPNRPGEDEFIEVAQLLWTLLFAFCGGWVSLLMYWTGHRQPDASR